MKQRLNTRLASGKILCSALSLCLTATAQARTGAVNYTQGLDGLRNAVTFVVTMMSYTVDILYAIASIVAILSALKIYIAMQNHETEIKKQIIALVGSILFIIGASIVMPAFFGFRDVTI